MYDAEDNECVRADGAHGERGEHDRKMGHKRHDRCDEALEIKRKCTIQRVKGK